MNTCTCHSIVFHIHLFKIIFFIKRKKISCYIIKVQQPNTSDIHVLFYLNICIIRTGNTLTSLSTKNIPEIDSKTFIEMF